MYQDEYANFQRLQMISEADKPKLSVDQTVEATFIYKVTSTWIVYLCITQNIQA